MTIEEIANALANRDKGQFASVVVNRPAKLRKTFAGENLRKRSKLTIQLADYARRAPVQQAVEAGDREAPSLPPYVASAFYVDGVRFWQGKNGKVYFPAPLAGEAGQAKVEWLENGQPVALESIAHKLLASETAKRPSKAETEAKGQAQFVGIGLENVESIR